MQFLEYHTLLDMEITIFRLKKTARYAKEKAGEKWC